MRRIILIMTIIFFIISMFYFIYQKEEILKNGTTLILKLSPFSPYEFAGSGYINLKFDITKDIDKKLLKVSTFSLSTAIVELDKNGVGKFKRLIDKKKLNNNEILLNFTYRKYYKKNISKVSDRIYFVKNIKKSKQAKYVKFKVSKDGEAILINLLNKDFSIIKK